MPDEEALQQQIDEVCLDAMRLIAEFGRKITMHEFANQEELRRGIEALAHAIVAGTLDAVVKASTSSGSDKVRLDA